MGGGGGAAPEPAQQRACGRRTCGSGAVRALRDPLRDPERLIRRVYAYVAYRIGEGPDAEDVTSEVFERALRYRDRYDPGKAEPAAWLIGIARRCIADHAARRGAIPGERVEERALVDVEEEVVRRITLAEALGRLGERERELVALRYGADLSARQVGELLGMEPGAVDVALHRARQRLAGLLAEEHDTRAGERSETGRKKERPPDGTHVKKVDTAGQEGAP